jgi:hypothetical protein
VTEAERKRRPCAACGKPVGTATIVCGGDFPGAPICLVCAQRGFASELKARIERAAVAFDQPRQTEMVAGLRYAIGIVDATLSDYDVSEPACGSPTKAE